MIIWTGGGIMMRNRFWAAGALVAVLAVTTLLAPRPITPESKKPFVASDRTPASPGTQQSGPRALTRQQVAAQDLARTTALCVRDCRHALQALANRLQHTTDPDTYLSLFRQTMKEHPQFQSIRLTRFSPASVLMEGVAKNEDRSMQVVDQVKKTQTFYLSDLYETRRPDGKPELMMTIGVPIFSHSKMVGVLTADSSVEYIRDVTRKVDRELGTRTVLHNHDGSAVQLHEKAHAASVMDHPAHVQAQVDGARWKVSSAPGEGKEIRPRLKHNEVVVRFTRSLTAAEERKILSDIQGTCVKKNARNSCVFRSDVKSVNELVAYFKSHPAVKYVEPNTLYHPNELPNDVLYQSYQWNLPMIHTDTAWRETTGNPNVIIAVVDTGVDRNHPEFQGQLVPGYNVIDQNDNPQDDNGHGTHVAGIIAARTNNVEGIAGIDWNSKIMPVKTMGADGSGSVFDIADGIVWAVDHGANVINLSLGEYEDSSYLHDAIRYAKDKNVLVVAAMGNDNTNRPSYPAAYPEVLAVCATDENGNRADFSNYGPNAGISAPGVSIASTYPDHRYAALSGTSMASPHISGVAGLIRAINPKLSADQVRDILQRTATDVGSPGKDPYFGAGLVNVQAAIDAAKNAAQGQTTP
jgi:thermitase